MNLGSAFPPEQRLEVFNKNFHAGRILYLFCAFTKPAPKDKYVLMGCTTPQPVSLVINSRISEFIKRRPKLLSAQVLLQQSDYSCFDHDSYIDCSKAFHQLTHPIIENQVLRDMTRIKLKLKPETTALVIKAIQAAETISLRQKVWMLQALEATLPEN